MVQRREDSGFTLEPGQAFRIIGEDVREDFEGHIPAELCIPGAVHLTHAALADEGGDFVGAEAGATGVGPVASLVLLLVDRDVPPTGELPVRRREVDCEGERVAVLGQFPFTR